ncbi:AAA family ATPase [Candidatus Babeliales bacterium]|nr:AAA family ATPase [Candidatus Babeliales bacterium]
MFRSLNEIEYIRTLRFSTGISELDWIYFGEDDNWGLPRGKISLWSGPSGCGKSRSLISLAKNMSRAGHKVIYFQNEVNLSDFRSWSGNEPLSPTLYASDTTSLMGQLSDIEESGATLAIIDSIGFIDEFKTGHETNVKHIYKHYRELCKRTGVHVIFVCQLNGSYQIKGSTSILYDADISVDLDRYIIDKKIVKNHFTIGINGRNGGKHRYGQMGDGIMTLWEYSPGGAVCISDNRLEDEIWCDAHGIEVREKPEVPYGHLNEPVKCPTTGMLFFPADPKFFKKGMFQCGND